MKLLASLIAPLTFPSLLLADTVLLDFTADWCPPCRAMAPVLAGLEQEGYRVERIDVNRQPEKTRRFQVRNIPCFIVLKDGREAGRLVGLVSPERLRRLLGPVTRAGSPPGPRTQAAVQQAQPGWTAPNAGGAAADAEELIRRSVRLTVNGPGSQAFATGTVVRSVPGESLILTCSHLFDGTPQSAQVAVELFGEERPTRQLGELVARDRKADVALVRVRTPQVLPVARVAPPRSLPGSGMPAFSVGCDHGQDPTVWHMRITAIDKYLTGAPTIECTGRPAQGRSGGGLFDSSGHLIGVCTAAVASDIKGIYAGLKAVHRLLDRQGLAKLYKNHPSLGPPTLLAGHKTKPAPGPITIPPPDQIGLKIDSNLMLPEGAADAELICIVNGAKGARDGAPRVIMLSSVSRELWELLEKEQAAQQMQASTSLRRPTQQPHKSQLGSSQAERTPWVPTARQPVPMIAGNQQ